MPQAAVVAGVALMAAGAYKQYEAAGDQADAIRQGNEEARIGRERQMAAEQRRADLQAARSVRQAVRQARIARSMVVNAGANTGSLNSSGVAGGASSVGAQARENLNFINQSLDINSEVTAAQMQQANAFGEMQTKVADAQAESAQWGAIASLGGTIFSAGGGFKGK